MTSWGDRAPATFMDDSTAGSARPKVNALTHPMIKTWAARKGVEGRRLHVDNGVQLEDVGGPAAS